MDQQTQARWNEWAKALFNSMFATRMKTLADITGHALKEQLDRRDACISEAEERITRLERALERLERIQAGEKAIEWPLREKRSAAPVDESKAA